MGASHSCSASRRSLPRSQPFIARAGYSTPTLGPSPHFTTGSRLVYRYRRESPSTIAAFHRPRSNHSCPSLEDASTAFNLIKITSSDPFWAAFIDQVVVGDDRQLEIIPRVGGARISVGTLENLQTKLDNLLTFYQAQIARGNLNDYKRIDLAFEGQVVAQRYY